MFWVGSSFTHANVRWNWTQQTRVSLSGSSTQPPNSNPQYWGLCRTSEFPAWTRPRRWGEVPSMVLFIYRWTFGAIPRIRAFKNSDLQWWALHVEFLRCAHVGIIPRQRGLQKPGDLQTSDDTAHTAFFISLQVLAFTCLASQYYSINKSWWSQFWVSMVLSAFLLT